MTEEVQGLTPRDDANDDLQTWQKNVFESDVEGRLDLFLREVTEMTRSQIKSLIEKGVVQINGKTAMKGGEALKPGDLIQMWLPPLVPIEAKPENLPIDIVYEDEALAVINKAQGMVVHPAPGSPNGTLVNALLYHLSSLSGINGEIRPGIVHRLDKNTSGLLVVAKTDRAHLGLAEQIAAHTAHRNYIALTDGNWKEDAGEIIAPVGRSPQDRKKMAVVPDGRFAKTCYTVEKRYGQYTLLRFRLHTGRTHQIRVHCAYMHHPIVGDVIYGGSNAFHLNGQMLHAYRLEFKHPLDGRLMVFEAPLPAHFRDVLEKLDKKEENG